MSREESTLVRLSISSSDEARLIMFNSALETSGVFAELAREGSIRKASAATAATVTNFSLSNPVLSCPPSLKRRSTTIAFSIFCLALLACPSTMRIRLVDECLFIGGLI